MKNLTFLSLSFILLCSPITGFSQELSTLLNTNPTANDLNALEALGTEEEFLHVDEAYQLEGNLNDNILKFSWVIADAYYLYGAQFKVMVDGQPLNFTKPDGIISYDAVFEEDLEKHYTFVELTVPIDQLTAGEPSQIAIHSQGCADAGLCYPPQVREFTLSPNLASLMPVAVVDRFAYQEPPIMEPTSTTPTATLKTAISMILLALTGGMILNLMPCVLPVLSLKALSLSRSHSRQEQIQHGWSYTFGVVTTFVVIASVLLAVRAGGQAVGWGFQLQTPWFVSSLILLFLVMGLSLSGLIALGGKWMGWGQNLTQGNSLQSSYFTGVLSSIVASPCTAPFMATALGFALSQPSALALAIFASLGLGMALPFLLLSYLPMLSRYLPKPGPWMETFKQALAFPLYLTALWLLWVLGQQLGTGAMIAIATTGLSIIFIYWLSKHSKKIHFVSHALVLVLVMFIGWKASQMPPVSMPVADNTVWEKYSPERLDELRQSGEAVFVNMTADWCITCKANEKFVLTEATLNDMKAKQITLIKGDWTQYDPKITRLLERYGRGGVPLYLLFPAKANAEPIVLPQILIPGKLNEAYSAI